jgi:hypothetical protein
VNPLILAEPASPLLSQTVWHVAPGQSASLHDTFPSVTGTLFASPPAQGAIVCRAVCNQAMFEPALGWVEHLPGNEVEADLL